MTILFKALCWAAALILLAVGARLGVVSERAMRTLMIVLPIVAVLALRGGRCSYAARGRT